jgi:cytochrome c oxidase assembly protein subunit 15
MPPLDPQLLLDRRADRGCRARSGWWMVHSGLQEGMTSVASYRLATHLGLAFVILGLIAWQVHRWRGARRSC